MDAPSQLLVLALLTVAAWGLESLSQYGADKLWRTLAQTLQHELRVETYNHLQELELAYFEDRSTGTLLSILNDDINQLERFLNLPLPTTVALLFSKTYRCMYALQLPSASLELPGLVKVRWSNCCYGSTKCKTVAFD